MARPRKVPPTLDDMAAQLADDLFYARLAQLERAVGILANYIVERDQLRYVGADADLVGVAREFERK